MIAQIRKFTLSPGTNTVRMPIGSILLSVEVRHETPVLYALVKPSETLEAWEVSAVPTGMPFEWYTDSQFLGTTMLHDGRHVVHIFARLI